MSPFQHAPVEARLVHKEHLDDVLISNFRGELPTRFPSEVLSLEWLTATQRALLDQHYLPVREPKDCLSASLFPPFCPRRLSEMRPSDLWEITTRTSPANLY